ncbi:hypothetical protein DWB61_03960 [Ancylomarina euxinus]|uniref:Uncharacterized protein n=1 Tax=Ancylomarina euxinus TaxID=2283627 RepID=A0A425Y500_9BACT|nr:hypothetical protein [Ancylomarina euxinus]MCZ4694434.1 hypothetical protein [Ancylomarina euxinus]MUP16666.1 hypothetical protein [Ancylomarina euxinus]RRG23557.1 hypothetical protein DWB61_03960 [Ancylomarina euxinus]
MKNIYKLLIALVVLVSSAELAKAQSSTFEKPWPGSTHTYGFDNIAGGSTTTWYISRAATLGAAPITFADPADSEFTLSTVDGTIVADASGNLSGTAISDVKIFWTGKATGTYYLFVNVEKDGCSNVKGIKIDVQTGLFNAILADVTGSDNPGTVDPLDAGNDIITETCPDQSTISPIVNLTPDSYSLGTSKIVYRVNREYTNTTNGWQVAFTNLRADATILSVIEAGGKDITASFPYVVAGDQDYVLVTVTVKNELSTLDVVLTLDKVLTKDLVTMAEDSGAGDSATHTFKAMPTIGAMNGN